MATGAEFAEAVCVRAELAMATCVRGELPMATGAKLAMCNIQKKSHSKITCIKNYFQMHFKTINHLSSIISF
jgi:hypothetical protein